VPEPDRVDEWVIVADLDWNAVVTDAVPPVAGEIPAKALPRERGSSSSHTSSEYALTGATPGGSSLRAALSN
jgi:hypothetical protein